MNFALLHDDLMIKGTETLAPEFSLFNLKAPREVSTNISMPKPVVATISHWMEYDDPVDPVKRERMLELV